MFYPPRQRPECGKFRLNILSTQVYAERCLGPLQEEP
jgi:hypothetical protein